MEEALFMTPHSYSHKRINYKRIGDRIFSEINLYKTMCQLQKKQTGMEEREPDMEFEDLLEQRHMENRSIFGKINGCDMESLTKPVVKGKPWKFIKTDHQLSLCIQSYKRTLLYAEVVGNPGTFQSRVSFALIYIIFGTPSDAMQALVMPRSSLRRKTIDFLSAKTQQYIMNTTYTDRVLSLEIFMNVSIKPNLMAATSILDIECYECGESGHLSYACPKNMLGEREPPKKKEKKKKKKIPEPAEEIEEVEESEDEGEGPALDSLSQARAFQQAKIEEEQKKWKPRSGGPSTSDDSRHPRIKKSTYFSDEEELSD
ncbi:hypothetical protein JEQ12_018083 [Ovis aries]|uniref:CCHC-type domain-containing protein n=1 Tax=Ovis aries TaxID=9940 RepID=A0A836A2L7_SHEEP|nr:hypothetical protein JEQ12_018083 [Ovis aries]